MIDFDLSGQEILTCRECFQLRLRAWMHSMRSTILNFQIQRRYQSKRAARGRGTHFQHGYR
jgi:hypothetical protein